MNKVMNTLANGGGAIITRTILTSMMGIILFFGNQISQDIRTEFSDLKKDISDVRDRMVCMVSKDVFNREMEHIHHSVERLEDKILQCKK